METGKKRQDNRGTGTGNREWRQVKRDRINGDRITEEQRYSNKDKVTR